MTKNIKFSISILLIIISIGLVFFNKKILAEYALSSKLKGKILLQVEGYGEAWYVYPYDLTRHYLGRPEDAFYAMQSLGVGITNNDLIQIPIAEANFEGQDSDNDGLSDAIENSLGTNIDNQDSDDDGYDDKTEILNNYNPLNNDQLSYNSELQNRLSGVIVIQIEQNGEAWYINPDNLKRYYLGRPLDAFNLMRKLGLGITNKNLALIDEYKINPEYESESIVTKFTELLNGVRKYTDPAYNYSFDYPGDWRIVKTENEQFITQITDSERDYIYEKKGVISLRHYNTSTDIGINQVRIATKGISTTLSDEQKVINNKDAYENSYDHPIAYEKTTTIKIGPSEFIQVSLATAKYNDDYYIKIYDDLLASIEFVK